ncbi:hypothetical protein [Curtobacterium sp. VKM Ac-1376]|uniref:hypothetical protein n=1 Tax=Curtobacterium sp. VKM Ac-1376 TaxID=123312 RepID=UPI00188BBDC1|nr:hypothetical protein [Curtobacterium sp. VKM Ac-1376]MBF4615813.1 hypothetical protein [Curtobacterium sp. VKM Ac-1376]
MLLGVGSVVIALVEPQQSGAQTGFIVSTIGISAIVFGVQAIKTARWGSAVARAFGRGGAILGSVGTALMAYAVIGSALTGTGVHLPALSLPLGRSASVAPVAAPQRSAVAAPVESAAPAVTPAPAVPPAPTSIEAERSAVVRSAGTLAFVMQQSFGAGPYPSTLSVGMSTPERILLPDGTGLAAVPDGARVLYSVAPDGSAWTVTIIGARFGAVATYSSTIGTVESG